MFNKNDPLVQSVQKVMEENERRRQVEAKLCEELGIYSRKELPHEHQKNYDALLEQRINEGLHPNQQKLDVHEPEKDKLTAQDFKMLRAKKTMKEEDKKEKPISEKIDKEKEAYSKMRQELVGKGTDRKTTEKLVSEEGDETREGGAVVDTKTNKPVVSATATKAEGPSPAERAALTNKIKQMKEAMLSGPETGPRKTPGSNQMNEEQLDEKAVSKAQHRFFGLVRAIQKGKAKGSEEAEKAAKEMSATEVRKFAKTKEKGLPEKKSEMKESHTLDSVMEEIKKKLGNKKMKEIDEQDDNPVQPMSDKDKQNAQSQASSMMSTPTSTPAPASQTPAQRGVTNPRTGTAGYQGPEASREPAPKPEPQARPAAIDRDQEDIRRNTALNSANKEPAPKPTSAPAPETKSAPAPAVKPEPKSFSQAFAAARKEAGGAGGKFTWQGKEYQTNVRGEKYRSAGSLKSIGMRESLETTIRNVLKD